MGRLCSSRYERQARQCGWLRIAGLDEVGRGSLFGPVVAAAVILNPRHRIVGLDDSKKLSAERRAVLAERIRENALAWSIAEVDAQRIDAWNIYQASRQAMAAALALLKIAPDYLLIIALPLVSPATFLFCQRLAESSNTSSNTLVSTASPLGSRCSGFLGRAEALYDFIQHRCRTSR